MNQKNKQAFNQFLDFSKFSNEELDWFYSIINRERADNKKLLKALQKHEEFKQKNGINSEHIVRM